MVLYNLTNRLLWGSSARITSLIGVKLGAGFQARRGDGIRTGHGDLAGQKALLKTIWGKQKWKSVEKNKSKDTMRQDCLSNWFTWVGKDEYGPRSGFPVGSTESIKAGHDCENWPLMSTLNHNLAILRSPCGCLPSAVWECMMMCGIYGCRQQNNNKLAHYKCSGAIVPNLCPLPWQLNRSGL